jgi:hypothetical protein
MDGFEFMEFTSLKNGLLLTMHSHTEQTFQHISEDLGPSSLINTMLFFYQGNTEVGFDEYPSISHYSSLQQGKILFKSDELDTDDELEALHISIFTDPSNQKVSFNLSQARMHKKGPKLIIFKDHKNSINKYQDKVFINLLKIPENEDKKKDHREKLGKFTLGELVDVPDLSPNLKFWIKLFIVIGFIVAMLILILVILLRKLKNNGDEYEEEENKQKFANDNYISIGDNT